VRGDFELGQGIVKSGADHVAAIGENIESIYDDRQIEHGQLFPFAVSWSYRVRLRRSGRFESSECGFKMTWYAIDLLLQPRVDLRG
jgi:hypothetical protein